MAGQSRARSVSVARRALAVALLLLAATPVLPASAADSLGAATQDGWWNRLQGPAESEPDGNPLRPLVPALPKPPTVPADAIATGGAAGQVDKVAAVGIDLTLADHATVEGLTLRLKESTAGGANVGADQARVIACPATTPWGPAQNGAWRDRPVADCGIASAEGVRAADGTWTFDLTALGRLWGDRFAPLPRNGVVLAVDPTATRSAVQVSWLNLDSGGIAVELAARPGYPVDAGAPAAGGGRPGPVPLAAAAPAPSIAPYTENPTGLQTTTGADATADPLAFAAGPPVTAPAASNTPAPVPGPPPGTPAEAAVSGQPVRGPAAAARTSVDFWERVPGPTILLVPVAVGLAVLIGVVLGPVGRPSPVIAREGGLSRALARRSIGGSGDA